MDKTHSLTTTWTCECGLENSIIKRSCTKCGKSIPDDTRQHIYEEEIRAANKLIEDLGLDINDDTLPF